MSRSECDNFSRNGTVVDVTSHKVSIRISQPSACEQCHAKGACTGLFDGEKIVEIKNSGKDLEIGDLVSVSVSQKTGITAVFWSYLLPFMIVILSLVALMAFFKNELLAGMAALSTLLPYYLLIYRFRKKIENKIQFKIEKL